MVWGRKWLAEVLRGAFRLALPALAVSVSACWSCAVAPPSRADETYRLPFVDDLPDDEATSSEAVVDEAFDPDAEDAPSFFDDPSILGARSVLDPISAYTSALLGEETGRELWTGVDVAEHTWLVFSGFTYAPMGGIFDNGPRVRIMGGYGGYSYVRKTSVGSEQYAVEKSYVDVLGGYQHRLGPLTAKAFAGVSYISHDVTPLDPLSPVMGSDAGIKAMIELWLNLTAETWASLDAAWAKPFNTSNVRSRLGYRVLPRVSLGLEGALNIDEGVLCRLPNRTTAACDVSPDIETATALVHSGRGGVFARVDWITGEASLSVGAIGTEGDTENSLDPYATLQWLSQF